VFILATGQVMELLYSFFGAARGPVKTRRRVAVNFDSLDEPERALVLFQQRILRTKRARRDRFDLIFLFTFFIQGKK
jgi:hypothetical protein